MGEPGEESSMDTNHSNHLLDLALNARSLGELLKVVDQAVTDLALDNPKRAYAARLTEQVRQTLQASKRCAEAN